MNAKEYKEKRRVILLDMATEHTLKDRFDCIESTLSRLDTLEADYIKGDPVAEGSRPLRERYEDALEVVRKQALIIEDLEAKASLFQQVMQASETLVTRFGGELTRSGAIGKYEEECQEFLEAIYEVINSEEIPRTWGEVKSLDELKKEATREFIDMVVTAGGVMSYLGITWTDIEDAVKHVIAKNQAKTTETHLWHEESKTVMRKDKVKP